MSMDSNNWVNGTNKVNRNKPIGMNTKNLLIINFAKISKDKIKKNIPNNPCINESNEPTAFWL